MTQAELNKNAVKSIFAIDDAKAQLESFGSQLDLGLPPEEDYEPKGFDELMTVNPSTDPNYGDSSEKFADLGDDLQDEQTQKFVIDKFAEEAAKRPGTTITAADITDICGAVQCAQLAQGGTIIKGDLVGFIKDTIAKAKNAQQSQNVSDAQPNGTVADDIAPVADDAAAPAPAEDPNALGGPAPVMDPVEPTVEPTEPSLEPNVDDGLGADPLTGNDGLGALDTGIDNVGVPDDLGVEGEPAPVEGAAEGGALDASGLDGLDDLDNDLGALDNDLGLGEDDATAPAEGDTSTPESEPKDEPKADEPKDEPKEKSDDSKKDEKSDKDEKKDDDFDFEAVAKQAQALTEGADDVADTANAAEETAVTESVPEGEATVTEEAGATADIPATEECGAAPATDAPATDASAVAEKQVVQESFNAEDAEAKVEAIAKAFRANRIAEKVQAQIEAYEAKEKKSKTMAQLDSVIAKFEAKEKARDKSAKVEAIVSKFAKASQEAAYKAQLEAIAAKDAELKGKLDSILESIDVKTSKEEKSDVVVESVNATEKSEPKSDSVVETISMIESAMAAMDKKEVEAKAQLESIVTEAEKRTEGDKLQKELDAIVESVRNS